MRLLSHLTSRLTLVVALIFFAGCNPFYVMEAALHEGRILLNRRDLDEVITQQRVTSQEAEALALVREARLYAERRGLSAGGTFTTFSPTDEDSLVWVVMGCQPDSFAQKKWWFPIVGSVPYKGFFSRNDAVAEAKKLNEDGFETFVRGASAFSTLGWFDDPVLTPLLKNPPTIVVNTVIHELVHRSLWVPGDTSFNESLAHFIGSAETIPFFREQGSGGAQRYAEAAERFARELAVSELTERLYRRLKTIYESSAIRDEKLEAKRRAFGDIKSQARAYGINPQLFERANNAEFLQLFLYTRHLSLFNTLYQREGADLPRFLARIRQFIASGRTEGASATDIFESFGQFVHTSG